VSPALAQERGDTRAAALVKTTSAHVLVTPKGKTLYVFAPDPKGTSTCYGECAKFWPPCLVGSNAHPATTIAGIPGTFGVITRTDGARQLTYDGAPLYTFAGDKKLGDMNGQGLFASGGYW
jgi:predicted lipoprotein with Yx(FWY)xxD motif